jgi:SAM-dependent methyltransferase
MAESFGADAERYDRARPRYPDALIERIVVAGSGRDVLDVGCGTGIGARQFRAAGCAVLGIDPDTRMAEFARRDGLDVEVATFEDWDDAGRTFDVLVAGQSWHWVDPVAGAAKAARVLRTNGVFAAFWHVFQPPAEIAGAFATALATVMPDAPFNPRSARPAADAYQTMIDTAADGIRTTGAFNEPEQWRFDWQRDYTRDEWLDLLPTQGIITRLPADKLAAITQVVGSTIDALGGGFTMAYSTVAIAATRR